MLKSLITDYAAFLQDEKRVASSSSRTYLRAVTIFLETALSHPEWLFLPPDWAAAATPEAALRHVDKRAVESYLNHLGTARGWKPATTALQATALRSFFGFFQRGGHLERNPARSLHPHQPPREETLPEGSEETVLKLFEQDGKSLRGARLLLLLELMYGGAVQSTWVYAIRSLKVDRKQGLVRIETPEQSLEVALSPEGLGRVEAYLKLRRAAVGKGRKGAFWVNGQGGAQSPVRLAGELKHEMERVDLPPRPALLRQLAARHFAERGGDTRSVRNLLRAKRLGSLDRYAPTNFSQVARQFRAFHPREGGER